MKEINKFAEKGDDKASTEAGLSGMRELMKDFDFVDVFVQIPRMIYACSASGRRSSLADCTIAMNRDSIERLPSANRAPSLNAPKGYMFIQDPLNLPIPHHSGVFSLGYLLLPPHPDQVVLSCDAQEISALQVSDVRMQYYQKQQTLVPLHPSLNAASCANSSPNPSIKPLMNGSIRLIPAPRSKPQNVGGEYSINGDEEEDGGDGDEDSSLFAS